MTEKKTLIRVLFVKMKPAFFELSKDEQTAFMARDRANLDALGMKAIAMIDCRERDPDWEYIGVEEWPSESALQERELFEKQELKISEYIDYRATVGTGQSFADYGKSESI